ncbi:unnamed protein product, partial [marine sediment metagenome]
SGEIDLSVGASYAFSAVITGLAMTNGFTIGSSIIVGMLAGLVVGIVNGILATYGRIPSLIVTLGMLSVVRGAALILSRGLPISLSGRTVIDPNLDKFLFIGQGKIFDTIPMMSIFLLAIV